MPPDGSLLAAQPEVAVLRGKQDCEIPGFRRRRWRAGQRLEPEAVIGLQTARLARVVGFANLDAQAAVLEQAKGVKLPAAAPG